MANTQGILIGATIGTLLGSIAVACFPRRKEILQALQQKSGVLARRAQEVAEVLKEEQRPRKKEKQKSFITGSCIGLLAGAGTALLLAPKSGKALRNQIAKTYTNSREKGEEYISVLQNHTHAPKKRHRTLKSQSRQLQRSARAYRN